MHLADLERALAFWHGVLGFEVTQRLGPAPPPGTTGLDHVAVRFPDRRTLAQAVRRVLDAGIAFEGASDHGVSEAIYLPSSARSRVIRPFERLDSAWLCGFRFGKVEFL